MNCRECTHWSLRDAARADMNRAKEGYGLCQQEKATFIMGGGYCSRWEQAEQKSIDARREFLGGWL